MKHFDLIKTAIGGTIWMSAYMGIASFLSKKDMSISKLLGGFVIAKEKTDSSIKEKASGALLHYSIGIILTHLYHQLFKNKIINPTLNNGSWLGFISGIIGVAGWKPFMALHPNPPKISDKIYLPNLVLAHILFGIGITYYYKKYNG